MYNDGRGMRERYPGIHPMRAGTILEGKNPEMAVLRIKEIGRKEDASSMEFLLVLDALMENKHPEIKEAARGTLLEIVGKRHGQHAEKLVRIVLDWKPAEGKLIEPEVYEKEKGNLFVNMIQRAKEKNPVLMAAMGLRENLAYVERMVVARAMAGVVGKMGEHPDVMVGVKYILNDLVNAGETAALMEVLPDLGQMRDNPGALDVLGSLLENRRIDEGGKMEVLIELGHIGGMEGLMQLRKVLEGKNAGMRLNAYRVIMGLSYLDNEGAQEHLPVEATIVEGALNAKEKPRTRIELIEWMGEYGKDVVVSLEWIIGHDPVEEVREAAERASEKVMDRTGEWNSAKRSSDSHTMPPGVVYVDSEQGGGTRRDTAPTQAIETVGTARWDEEKNPIKRGGAAGFFNRIRRAGQGPRADATKQIKRNADKGKVKT